MTQKVNMSQLIEEAADAMGVFRTEASELIQDYFVKNILRHLREGKEVSISPIGVLYADQAKRAREDGEKRLVPKLRPAVYAKLYLSGEIKDSEGNE
jgi:nucleoid DNA-binding protein